MQEVFDLPAWKELGNPGTQTLKATLPRHLCDETQRMFLDRAIRFGRADQVRVILDACDEITPKRREQAIDSAAHEGQLDILDVLWGPSPTVERLLDAMCTAARHAEVACLDHLRARLPADTALSPVLAAAAQGGHLALVEHLLPFSDPTWQHDEALRNAVVSGHRECVVRLLPVSSFSLDDCNDEVGQNNEQWPALAYACENGDEALFELLLPHSNPRAQQSQALRSAVGGGHHGLARRLLPLSDVDANYSEAVLSALREPPFPDYIDDLIDRCDVDQAFAVAMEVRRPDIADHLASRVAMETLVKYQVNIGTKVMPRSQSRLLQAEMEAVVPQGYVQAKPPLRL